MAGIERSWRVPADHPAFAGHFPGRPIVPGVVLLDRVVQLAQQVQGGPVTGWQVTQVKFLSPCGPDELLEFAVRDSARGGLAFSVRCGDREVAAGQLQAPAP
jgi:3-hydroxymyristoyl/3-hydroxydecanoyl-(acyl carrier protein) dehydratase